MWLEKCQFRNTQYQGSTGRTERHSEYVPHGHQQVWYQQQAIHTGNLRPHPIRTKRSEQTIHPKKTESECQIRQIQEQFSVACRCWRSTAHIQCYGFNDDLVLTSLTVQWRQIWNKTEQKLNETERKVNRLWTVMNRFAFWYFCIVSLHRQKGKGSSGHGNKGIIPMTIVLWHIVHLLIGCPL